jgi:membrane protein
MSGRGASYHSSGVGRLAERLEETFLGRCARAFVDLLGVDRALVIASQAFTALIPMMILVSTLVPGHSSSLVADGFVSRFRLEGSAADGVEALFANPGHASIGIFSVGLLLFSALSLTRRLQRMYLGAWRMGHEPGVRGTLPAFLALVVLLAEVSLLFFARALVKGVPGESVAAGVASALAGIVLWATVPWLMLGRRLAWRRLLPTGVLTSAAATVYGAASSVYMPAQMARYTERYGLFGLTLALVSWLLALAFVIVVATVVASELDRSDRPWAVRFRERWGLTGPAAASLATTVTGDGEEA